MGKQVASKDLIQVLNNAARELFALSGGRHSPVAACRLAVPDDWDLVKADDQCEVYCTPTGIHVNLWIEAPIREIDDGGFGFDDQIEWAFEESEDEPHYEEGLIGSYLICE
jgi:hypothetical protein